MLILLHLIILFLPSVSYAMEEPTDIFDAIEKYASQNISHDAFEQYVEQHQDQISKGPSTLWWALDHRANNIPDMLKILLKNGAKPTINSKGITLLEEAAAQGNIESVEILIPHSMDVINRTKAYAPLNNAIWSKNIKIIQALLKAGADPNIRDSSGNTALDQAVKIYTKDELEEKNKIAIIQLLLDNNANKELIKPENQKNLYLLYTAATTTKSIPANPPDHPTPSSSSGRSGQAALGGNLGNAAQRNKLLQKIIGGAIVATAALYGFYHYLSQPVFIPSTLHGQELVDQLTDLLSTHDIEHAYALAEYNQDNLGNLSDIQRIALLSAINQAHGSITQAHATTYSWLSWYRSKSESDQFRQLHLIATLIHQSAPQLTIPTSTPN
jgi:Ankyrin repeats (3 copies)